MGFARCSVPYASNVDPDVAAHQLEPDRGASLTVTSAT